MTGSRIAVSSNWSWTSSIQRGDIVQVGRAKVMIRRRKAQETR